MPATSHVEQLLSSAIRFRNFEDDIVPLPSKFKSTDQATAHMRTVLMYDARVALQEPLEHPPDDLMFHTLDMDGETPGIISSTRPKVCAHRIQDPTADSGQAWATEDWTEASSSLEPIKSVPSAKARGPSLTKLQDRALKRAQTAAKRDIDHDMKTMEKRQKREEEQRRRENETPEERGERLEETRRKREEKKEARAAAAADEAGDESNERVDEGDDDKGKHDDDTAPAEEAPTSRKGGTVGDVDCASIRADHAILPPRMRVVGTKETARVFANPVPNYRHVSALQYAGIGDDALRHALLEGIACDRLEIIQGPPGTGKTSTLVDRLCKASGVGRVLVCAHSNVAVIGLYMRLLHTSLAEEVSLCVPPSRVPDSVVVASNDPSRRIVCATISSRAGPRLHGCVFDAVFVDEAAQCSEACFWALVRPDVTRICMAGDVKQLRAVAASNDARQCEHDRSLMERLMVLEYPTTALTLQRRMHPEICSFPSRAFYDGALVTHPERQNGSDGDDAYQCVVIEGGCVETVGTSMFNDREVDACVDIVERERRERKATDVVVLCPYQAQCRAVLARGTGVPVHTIDSFQGREADVVVLTMVRTGDECGFWTDARRLVVALTRAKHRLYVVGSFDWSREPLNSLCDDARERRRI